MKYKTILGSVLIVFVVIMAIVIIPKSNHTYAINLPDGVPYSINKDNKEYLVDENIAKSKGYFVYGSPSDITGNEQKQGQWRYFGFDINGNPFSNIDFPNDVETGLQPWEKDWIKKPWLNKLCYVKGTYEVYPNEEQWLDNLKWQNGWSGDVLKDYLYIQSPPTDWGCGSARGWHNYKGQILYQTFILKPLQNYLDYQNRIPGGPGEPTQRDLSAYTELNFGTDGCFLDVPQLNDKGNLETYIIRGFKKPLTQNTKIKMIIWEFDNLDESIDFIADELLKNNKDKGKLIFDDYATFTVDEPFWVKKIEFPKPGLSKKSGLVIQTGLLNINNDDGVMCYVWNTARGTLLPASHNTSDASFSDVLPWDKIEAKYGIKRILP